MSDACLKQIKYWHKAIQQLQKGIKRKNKLINRLQMENNDLISDNAMLMVILAELEMEDNDV